MKQSLILNYGNVQPNQMNETRNDNYSHFGRDYN